MNPRILAIIVFLVVLLGALGIWFMFATRTNQELTNPGTQPFGTATTTQAGNVTTTQPKVIRDRAGTAVTVPDFTNGHAPVESGSGGVFYDLVHTGAVYGNETDSFGVQFDDASSEFLVSLITEPLSAARINAEQFLRTKLDLSDSQLCALNIRVITTNDVNTIYANKGNLGLSFCPSAVKLP